MNQARIKQHGRVLSIWPTRAHSITKRVQSQAEARAKVGRRENLLEGGYYEVEIVDEQSQIMASESLIA